MGKPQSTWGIHPRLLELLGALGIVRSLTRAGCGPAAISFPLILRMLLASTGGDATCTPARLAATFSTVMCKRLSLRAVPGGHRHPLPPGKAHVSLPTPRPPETAPPAPSPKYGLGASGLPGTSPGRSRVPRGDSGLPAAGKPSPGRSCWEWCRELLDSPPPASSAPKHHFFPLFRAQRHRGCLGMLRGDMALETAPR